MEAKRKWSYSSLSTFEHCKYCYYLRYIIADPDIYYSEDSYYTEVGIFMHDILRRVFDGSLSLEDAPKYFADNYDNHIFHRVSQKIMSSTYEACANYLANTEMKWRDDYDILGAEKEFHTEIDGRPFIGFIDLILRHKKTKDIIVVDHKSSKYPLSEKTGKPLKASESTFESYKRQMYIYCKAIKEAYGEYPKTLVWNHFKESKLAKIPFSEREYDSVMKWYSDTLKKIDAEKDYPETYDYFYCNNICEFRTSCEYAKYMEESKEKGGEGIAV